MHRIIAFAMNLHLRSRQAERRIVASQSVPLCRPLPRSACRRYRSLAVYNPDVSTGPQLVGPPAPAERNWLPLAIAAGIVVVIVGALILFLGHGKNTSQVTPISAQADPYAANLPITNLAMSESSNLAGGKVTYLDGQIANKGDRTVSGITVQVLFRNYAHEVAQNETLPLMLIRTRDPYVDLEPVSAAALKPGGQREFRLIFDTVADSWDGAYPEIRLIHVDTK